MNGSWGGWGWGGSWSSCQQGVTRWKIACNGIEKLLVSECVFYNYCVRSLNVKLCVVHPPLPPPPHNSPLSSFTSPKPCYPLCKCLFSISQPAVLKVWNFAPRRRLWPRPPCLCWGPRASWTAAPRARWAGAATASWVEIRLVWQAAVRPDS